jgi:alpha-mannosidase
MPTRISIGWATGALALGLSLCPSLRAALDPTRDKILYMVATAHLDDQWNWTIQDTINSFIPNTLHQNFTYFSNPSFTNYTFSFEEAWRYQLINEYYPADFLTLSNYIAQGRWRVAGSVMVAGDVNTPAPESLIRHTLYANNYWRQQFGKTSVDIFLPDCFGFGYALPSVAAHCGLKGFSSQKLSWGCWTNIPFQNIGRWVGPDGSSIVAALQPGSYTSTIGGNLANDSGELNRLTNNFRQTGLYLDYRYFGTGDQGGAPDAASVSNVCLSVQTTGAVHVLNTGSDQLFRDLTPAQVSMLPTYQGELLMQTHGTGTYTAHAENKKYHRQCEQAAAEAECASVLADWLQGGGTYPQERLNKSWARFLWHEFHDDLTGTSIPSAYSFSWNDYLLALNELTAETAARMSVVGSSLDTTAAGVPLVVFNPLSVAREDLVEATVTFADGVPAAIRVFAPNGDEVPSQMGTPSGATVPVTFLADVPSMGAAVYDVRPSPTPCTLSTGLSVANGQIESTRYRVLLNANGDVSSILDKVNNQQLLSAPIRWEFLYDLSTSWPCWEVQYNNLIAAPVSYLSAPATVQVLENGPARVTLAVLRNNAGSTFVERIRLGAGNAGDRVEWDVSAHWATLQTLLKLDFPLAVSNPYATFDLGLGTIQRPNETPNLYEVPAQQWADLTASSGSYGITLMSDSKYGWDKPANNELRLSIFHTPAVGGSFVYEATNSVGTHHMLLAVMGHRNDWRTSGSAWVAARLNQPLQAFQTLPHTGSLGKNFGFLSCNNSNVMVKAIKKAENSSEIIVRLQELTGQPQSAQLSLAAPILTARQVTGAEDPVTTLNPSGGVLTISLSAYQPMTLALTLSPPTTLIPKPQSLPLALPFNLDAISTDANRTDGNFDSGYTYPAELMPSSIVRDGLTFRLGPTNDAANNALSCQGQTLALPAGYNDLYFLAAAASNDVTATFTLNTATTNITVRYFSGFIGQWYPPFLKKDEIGWICTHRHNGAGLNEAYNFCYLFKYHLDLPPGTSSLTLPTSPNLRIFAITLVTNAPTDATITGGALGQNLLPWANAGASRIINAGQNGTATVTLDASGSADPDGTIASYLWSQNGTVFASSVNPTVTLPIGTNHILLTVTDNEGGIGQDIVTLTVLPPLSVTLTATPTNATAAPLTVQFSAQAGGGLSGPQDTTDDHQGTISAQGENTPNEAATNAFDDNLSSKWLDFANVYPSTRSSWIQYQYANGIGRFVTNYTITSANDSSSYPARNPANWHLLGSNDGGTTWTTLDIETNQAFTASQQTLAWNVSHPGTYNIYRLQIDSVANPPAANSVQLDEIQLIGPALYSYWWSFGDGATATTQNPQHTYSAPGEYLVILGVTTGAYSGTNSALITIGPALTASLSATPDLGATPLTVQFTGQGAGGNGARAPYDTTDDQRGTVTAQGNNPPNETCVNAFDDTTASKWLDFASAFPSTRSSWIQYQYAAGLKCIVSQYTITSANDSPERDPANWRLLGSNDGGTTWTTLDAQINQLFTNRFETLAYAIPNTNAYNLFRFQIDRVANPALANSVQLSELAFIGDPAYSYLWSFGDGTLSTAQNPRHTYLTNGTYSVTLQVYDGAATATASTSVTALPLVLGFSQITAGQIGLSWPQWGSNCSLYVTTDLTPPIAWSLVTNHPVVLNGTNTVILPSSAGNRFFQLRN